MNTPSRPLLSAIQRFLALESASGMVLVAMMVLALGLANSPWADAYQTALDAKLGPLSVLHWINDGLMAVFFLLVAMEIKREFVAGELSQPGQLALPALAALGGMAVPAAIYVALDWNDPAHLSGWAIPTATDIAFSLGVLALLGSRVPLALKVFLTALAIIDDLGAILVIALFYSGGLNLPALAAAAAATLILVGLNRAGIGRTWPYLLVGLALWASLMPSGLHATIGGVILGLTIPLKDGQAELEHSLHPWVAFLILPIFALANAGIGLNSVGISILSDPVFLGIAAGLFLGKQAGVFGASWAAIRLGLAPMPQGADWRSLYGVAVLTGIGFTMSLFIGGLAFPDGDAIVATRLGVIVGSLASALAGLAILSMPRPPAQS
ncbi:Na+/H+ antiporter NhaA [Magnetospirillum moscoviense]|nr:Na+/H+ antiporter NhaA [Magnetospirillum moscoviense]MBF0324804.1 Na+/H+ antiporter NhaA [Alphaproteobacteria bacterium]